MHSLPSSVVLVHLYPLLLMSFASPFSLYYLDTIRALAGLSASYNKQIMLDHSAVYHLEIAPEMQAFHTNLKMLF